ncbi:hypothetical protein PVAP13_8KG030751 [Panicum virgatum]|uniref:Uncharacterized protein n=1 Tax=Panicum virgatum TaxID=38727 RepID=A0A8T0PHB9_PANVG|nr:hypothetical protein PVAP13_8KG030751 [Panicum virgatum]
MPEVGATRAMPEDRRGGMLAAAPCLLRLAQHGPGHPLSHLARSPLARQQLFCLQTARCTGRTGWWWTGGCVRARSPTDYLASLRAFLLSSDRLLVDGNCKGDQQLVPVQFWSCVRIRAILII